MALAAPVFVAFQLSTAHATIYMYDAILDGPSEFPANASPGTGFAEVNYDDFLHTLQVEVSFSGLTGTTTASHIHAATTTPFTGTAGVATTTPYFAGFPIGVTSGSYSNTLDLTLATSYNGSYITANGGTTKPPASFIARPTDISSRCSIPGFTSKRSITTSMVWFLRLSRGMSSSRFTSSPSILARV